MRPRLTILAMSLLSLPSFAATPRGGRSVVVASNALVASRHPLPAMVGIEVLKQGGDAIDAARALTAAPGPCAPAPGLREPGGGGVGGDLYAIVWDAKSQKLYGLNASGRSPYRTSI